MSEAKFTPGPWWVDCHNKNVFITDSENNTAVCKIMHLRPDGADNAHLIAASPELYEALAHAEEILRDVAKVSGLTHSDAESCADTCFAALAKARGEV